MKIVLVTGGFDPLHSGHIEYFKAAKQLGDKLVVGINSDEWLTRKKGRPFLVFEERKTIIQNLVMVDWIISFNDDDDTSNKAIEKLLDQRDITLVFANGGDKSENIYIPEYEKFKNNPRVKFEFGVGGRDKKNSSSWILKEWKMTNES